MLRKIIGLLLAALPIAFLVLTTGSPAASAHAVLESSDPLDGSRLTTIPARVSLRFDEPVRIIAGGTKVVSTAGGRADTGRPIAGDGGRSVIITLDRGLATQRATYLVSYRIVSADGHVVVGSIRFGVGQSPAAINQPVQTGAGPPGVIAAVGTGLGYAGLVGTIGCLAVAFLIWPSALRSTRLGPVTIGGPVLIMLGTVAQLVAATPAADGTGWAGMLQPQNVPFTLITPQGRLLAVQFTLAAALLPLGHAIGPGRKAPEQDTMLRVCWGLAAVALMGAMAATGHGFAGAGRWYAWPATAVHLTAMAIWLGGVIDLLLVLRPRLATLPRTAGQVVDRWSRLAFGSIAALVLSGEVLAWRQIQPIEALWQTPYGITLLIKLGLAAIAVIIGWTGSRVAAHHRDPARIGWMLIMEMVIMALVVGAATVLSATPAARDQYDPRARLTAPFGDDRLEITIAGTRRGTQDITVIPVDRTGVAIPAHALTGRLSSTQAGVAALDVRFRAVAGRWQSLDATAPLPGVWQLSLTVSGESGPSYVTEVAYRVW